LRRKEVGAIEKVRWKIFKARKRRKKYRGKI
jgi:hypothetical protein